MFQVFILGPWARRTSGKRVRVLVVPQNRKDLVSITELCEAGKIIPFIDRRYTLSQAAEAFRHVAEGRARGKVVITIVAEPAPAITSAPARTHA